jgi:glycosyltransferase involved in cell wall biosynthesis
LSHQPYFNPPPQRPLRINFVLPQATMAGGIRVIAIYAERLVRRGHQVLVVSVPPVPIPLRSKIKLLLTGKGWLSSRPGRSHLDDVAVEHRRLKRYRPVVADDLPDADVVIANFWKTAPWVAALPPEKGAKAVFIQGYEVLPGDRNEALDATWRLPLHKIVISRWLVELARDRFGDPDVSHVPNSVDTQQFHAPPRGRQARPTVGFLYSHVLFKSPDLIPKVIEQVRREVPDLRVVAFGAEKPSSDLPLPDNTEYTQLPAQDAIREIYGACDVWLCASRREGFHLPPLEAMACRCPVVSTRVGGPMDMIEEGINGHLVDVGDIRALAERTVQVLKLPESQWRGMSDAALDTARRYTWDDATDLLEQALQRAMEKSAAGRAAPAAGDAVSPIVLERDK